MFLRVMAAREEREWERTAYIVAQAGNLMGAKPPLTVDGLLGRNKKARGSKAGGAALVAAIDKIAGLPGGRT